MSAKTEELGLAIDELYLRKAEEKDRDLLYEWTNDPLTRQNSFSTSQIPYEDHCRWFDVMLTDEKRIQYIIMVDSNAVGQIRIDIDDRQAEISYSIAANHRGKGYGKKALCLIKEEVLKNYKNVDKLIGQVKPDNRASSNAFLSEGYYEAFRQFELKIER